MRWLLLVSILSVAQTVYGQQQLHNFDAIVDSLVGSGMRDYVDLKGDSTPVLSDRYFQQYNSRLQVKDFKYSLITYYPNGKMWFFTGLYTQTYNRKKAVRSYELLANRVEKTRITCCTLQREPGTDLANEKKTYYKPFARPKEYANLQLIVALENVKQTNGKMKYNVLLYIYSNPFRN